MFGRHSATDVRSNKEMELPSRGARPPIRTASVAMCAASRSSFPGR
jgi:hypothetical protein